MTAKILIEIKGGNIVSVLSNEPIRFVVIDHDLEEINTPLIYENDLTSNNIFDLFKPNQDIYHELKTLQF